MFVPLVHVKEDESFENAMRRFKRKCEKSGILSELKKRQHYEKPSAKRKRKMIQARKKMLRKLSEEKRAVPSAKTLESGSRTPTAGRSSSTSCSASCCSWLAPRPGGACSPSPPRRQMRAPRVLFWRRLPKPGSCA